MSAVFVENNIEVTDKLILTPGLRKVESDKFGVNWSPSLNASYYVTPEITLKGGIARAFKAPNLFQINPNYMYATRGRGCPHVNGAIIGGPCNIFGNENLNPEISVNKEIGLAYDSRGWGAGLTYFHNDYKNKIVADMGEQGIPERVNGYRSFQWVIPRYTINSTLDWRLNEKISVAATGAFYGRQKPRSFNPANNTTPAGDELGVRGSYAIYGLSAGYEVNRNLYFRAGVDNVFDKMLYRLDSGTAKGASTYNEPGRAVPRVGLGRTYRSETSIPLTPPPA